MAWIKPRLVFPSEEKLARGDVGVVGLLVFGVVGSFLLGVVGWLLLGVVGCLSFGILLGCSLGVVGFLVFGVVGARFLGDVILILAGCLGLGVIDYRCGGFSRSGSIRLISRACLTNSSNGKESTLSLVSIFSPSLNSSVSSAMRLVGVLFLSRGARRGVMFFGGVFFTAETWLKILGFDYLFLGVRDFYTFGIIWGAVCISLSICARSVLGA